MNRELLMNVHQTQLPPLLTVADFLDWPGDGSGMRYELVDGVLRAMSPGSDAHNTIVVNLTGLIWTHLRVHKPGYRAVAALGVQPRLSAEWNYRIPDLGVTQAPNRPGQIMTPDPILLIEVLSPGNAQDTRENVRAYATLPTVQEIVVVHSTRMRVETMRRDATGAWPENPLIAEAVDDTIALASIAAEFKFTDIYAGTHLA
jgi:Uma2 family endonuclease